MDHNNLCLDNETSSACSKKLLDDLEKRLANGLYFTNMLGFKNREV